VDQGDRKILSQHRPMKDIEEGTGLHGGGGDGATTSSKGISQQGESGLTK